MGTTDVAAYPWRFKLVLAMLLCAVVVLSWRVIDLQILDHEFLSMEGDARTLRTEEVKAYRGMILDRNGEPLAVSTPVVSLWANPQEVENPQAFAAALNGPLEISAEVLIQRLRANSSREFIYLKRHLPPAQAAHILGLKVAGVYGRREYRRYYPAGEVAAHLVGFTNIDDAGQEGMELAYDGWLQGVSGSKLVMKDRYGRTVEDIKPLQVDKPGNNLYLSIDLRLQYLAYRELLAAVSEHKARSGSLVLLDAQTGEVLAMVNQPSYNPNKRSTINHSNLRNRAMTDVFEPGSTVKPLTVAAALDSGKYSPESRINTAPGYLRIGRNTVRDHRNYGEIDLTTLLSKSSNVGAGKLALSLDPDAVWSIFSRVRLGQDTGSGFPGERVGLLPYHDNWQDIELVTLSYGYGVSVTALQLAQAYTPFADQGNLKRVSLLKQDQPVTGESVMSAGTADKILSMLETVIKSGTGTRARVPFYQVAGKTGTVHKNAAGNYQSDKYLALFSGIAPVNSPRIVAVVVIDEPGGREYYGGEVAAPVFSRVITGAMRLLDVAPDAQPEKAVVDSRVKSGGDAA